MTNPVEWDLVLKARRPATPRARAGGETDRLARSLRTGVGGVKRLGGGRPGDRCLPHSEIFSSWTI